MEGFNRKAAKRFRTPEKAREVTKTSWDYSKPLMDVLLQST